MNSKLGSLELIYGTSTLRAGPDEARIKRLLLECLEMNYGRISQAIVQNPSMDRLLDDLDMLLGRYKTVPEDVPA